VLYDKYNEEEKVKLNQTFCPIKEEELSKRVLFIHNELHVSESLRRRDDRKEDLIN
jgi:hypothetical protein